MNKHKKKKGKKRKRKNAETDREKINTYNEINMRAMNNINVLLYRN